MNNPILKVRNKMWLMLGTCFSVLFLASMLLVYILLLQSSRHAYYRSVYEAFSANNLAQLDQVMHQEFYSTQLIFLIIASLIGVILFSLVSFLLAQRILKMEKSAFELKKQLLLMKKRFTANASHELHTPLTMIKGGIDEILSNKDQTIESQMKWFEMVGFGLGRMEMLTNELAILARLENETIKAELETIDISQTVEHVVDALKVKAEDKNVKTNFNLDKAAKALTHEEKFKQVLTILLDNAYKYVNTNGIVNIEVTCVDQSPNIKISNTGPGIPEGELPKVYEHFYRGDSSNLANSGTGLGLTIAKKIIEQLNGKFDINSIENELTTVEISF